MSVKCELTDPEAPEDRGADSRAKRTRDLSEQMRLVPKKQRIEKVEMDAGAPEDRRAVVTGAQRVFVNATGVGRRRLRRQLRAETAAEGNTQSASALVETGEGRRLPAADELEGCAVSIRQAVEDLFPARMCTSSIISQEGLQHASEAQIVEMLGEAESRSVVAFTETEQRAITVEDPFHSACKNSECGESGGHGREHPDGSHRSSWSDVRCSVSR